MKNFDRSFLPFHRDGGPWSCGMDRAPNSCLRPSFSCTFSSGHRHWIYACFRLAPRELHKEGFTFVLCWRVSLGVELGVDIWTMIEESPLVIFPAQPEAFPLGFPPGLLINCGEVISIRCWFFFGIPKHNIRDRPSVSTSKGATLARDSIWNLRLDDIRIIRRAIFESAILWETKLMRGMSPGRDRLIPPWIFLLHGDMNITEHDWGVGPLLGVKIGSIGLVAAHVMRGVHALILTESVLADHDNKFKLSIYYESGFMLTKEHSWCWL